jgi:uncharacterized membrane protein YidH (DUF202 family)
MDTSAATNAPLNAFISAVEAQIITPLVSLLVLAAFVLFVFGVVEYIRNAANEEKRAQGQQHIIWGLVGLVIIFGAGAIITILKNIIGIF